MKKHKSGWCMVPIPIYFGDLWIKFSNQFIEDANKIGVKLKAHENDYFGVALRKDDDGCGEYIIMIQKDTPSVIAHEALHLVNLVFEDRGVMVDTRNDEHQAYFLGWVVEQVYKARDMK